MIGCVYFVLCLPSGQVKFQYTESTSALANGNMVDKASITKLQNPLPIYLTSGFCPILKVMVFSLYPARNWNLSTNTSKHKFNLEFKLCDINIIIIVPSY